MCWDAPASEKRRHEVAIFIAAISWSADLFFVVRNPGIYRKLGCGGYFVACTIYHPENLKKFTSSSDRQIK